MLNSGIILFFTHFLLWKVGLKMLNSGIILLFTHFPLWKLSLKILNLGIILIFTKFVFIFREICEMIHENGGQVYLDGANMNAQVGGLYIY